MGREIWVRLWTGCTVFGRLSRSAECGWWSIEKIELGIWALATRSWAVAAASWRALPGV